MTSDMTAVTALTELTVGRVITHTARNQPTKLALYDGSRRVTYGELDAGVDCLASSLVAAGVAKGDVVSAYLPNCIDYVQVVLAVARAGAVFSPINPRFKAYEISRLISKAAPRIIFTIRASTETIVKARELAGASGTLIVTVDGGGAQDPAWTMDRLLKLPPQSLPVVEDRDYFSLMFTSGTTGEPKGALATHRARSLWVLNAAIQYGLNEDDVYLGTMPQVHSAGLTFTLIHLYIGATVRILEHFDPKVFLEIVEQEKITSSLTVPTMLTMILEARQDSVRRHDLGSLKRLVTCGSPLPLTVKKKVLETISDQLYDYYGSTESNSMSVLKPRDQLRKPNSVGQAFTNVELMIAGPDGKSAPAGETGEIWCSNPSCMTCYLDDPQETAAAFTGRWFHTGDLGYLDSEGYLYIVGRSKDLIVSGGVNVYPAEVEQVILQHPAVLDCAVVGVPDEKWGQAIKVFIKLRRDQSIDLPQLQDHCKNYLADYKKPRHLQVVDDIPKNAGGKTVKHALTAITPDTREKEQQ